jgi:hypothetical protein
VSRAPRKSNLWPSRAAPFSPLLLFSVTTAVAVWFLVVIGAVWPFIGPELISLRIAWISRSAFQRDAFSFQDEICPHAAAGEVLHTSTIFRAIGVGVEVSRPPPKGLAPARPWKSCKAHFCLGMKLAKNLGPR